MVDKGVNKIVLKQLKAYNRGEVSTFCSCFSNDVKVYSLGDKKPKSSGMKAFRKIYKNLFEKNPKLKCRIVNKIRKGKWAIDFEHLTGLSERNPFYGLAIYEVKGSKIKTVWFLR